MARRSHPKSNLVIGYVRVSTDEQALGPDAQRAALVRWCSANGCELAGVHEDIGVSGGAELDARPGLLAALDALAAHGAGVLLVAKRDRLARDVVNAAMVERLAERAGARVRSAAGEGTDGDVADPSAMLMRGIVDLFAQYERAVIRSRTKAALAVKRARGERVGDIPIGYAATDSGMLAADPREQAAVARIRCLRKDGASIRAIADSLNTEQVPARGGRWHPTTVARVIRRLAA